MIIIIIINYYYYCLGRALAQRGQLQANLRLGFRKQGFLLEGVTEGGAPGPELWLALLTGLACQRGTNTLTLGGGQEDWPLAAGCTGLSQRLWQGFQGNF